ncbi:helix-turn-helix domain-containing protein [Enterococcus faecalis]|uniref:helix-turn-helix domain-containing protein n=1 Tax=Enterococcus faecalis TaxID=1351 RepID=UPI00033049DD|nr:helix-turn-helix domain-containing protein [Enterococcus faecalis]EGO7879615.1 helix-turn-helix domain-containing protein [Enterococcus faecalis]EGO8337509.1 helix-turn-helix domain-containing protein [Enterococcus faecalis]EGO8753900.1 helix-turn-helix domain-containing protein [Enterococcus faecalis]EHH1627843.1 helix-turn-helix domain-containing protein [Enterococcus faecalis]EHP1379808.1 helix-turn-helix domain-containing protein [Enterococcus faecalis]
MNEHRGFYAIIPAIVRYDNQLNGNAKLLYGELTALANERGYCWATNQYFASLYNVSKRTIISWMKQLEKRKYIKIQVFYKPDSKIVDRRHIYILPFPTDTEFYTPSEENFITYGKNLHEGGEENFTTPGEENFTENNTLINNTKNNTKNKKNSVEQSSTMSELFEKVWKTYPKKTNKKKAKEQFLKKFKSEEDLDQFKKGYKDYLKYIKLNDWYHPQELFRWIRDDRYNDEYDLSIPTQQTTYSKPPVRQEKLPDWVNEQKQEEEKLSPEEQAELDRQIKEFMEGK